jgi:hypothetical protein
VEDESGDAVQSLDIYGGGRRHGLKQEFIEVCAAAAAVCMERHHSSPKTWSVQADDADAIQYQVRWSTPSDVDLRTYRNDDEATELGACALALAAAELHLGLVAYARAEPRTGIDFYLCLPREAIRDGNVRYDLDHQDAVGLEVSGIGEDTEARMNERLRRKIVQIRRGRSPDRAIAGVVGFRTAQVVFRTAKP